MILPRSVAALVLAVVQTTAGAVVATSSEKKTQSAGLASFDEVWQTIADTFYDPSFGGLDWERVRTELRPRAEAVGSVVTTLAALGARPRPPHAWEPGTLTRFREDLERVLRPAARPHGLSGFEL